MPLRIGSESRYADDYRIKEALLRTNDVIVNGILPVYYSIHVRWHRVIMRCKMGLRLDYC